MKVLEIKTWINEFSPNEINIDKIKEYLNFINEAVERYDSERYSERHHVMPKCIDKDKKFSNEVVKINGRDHFISHVKLVECFNSGRVKILLSSALTRMAGGKLVSSLLPEDYETARKLFADSQKGDNNPARRDEVRKKMKIAKSLNPPMLGVHRYGELAPFYGRQHTEETKRRISESLSGEKNGMYGKKGSFTGKSHTEETKRKISESKTGHKLSETTKQKMRESAKNRPPISEETRIKRSQSLSGEGNGMYGRSHAEESRMKMREAAKNKIFHPCCKSCGKIFDAKSPTTKYCQECKSKKLK